MQTKSVLFWVSFEEASHEIDVLFAIKATPLMIDRLDNSGIADRVGPNLYTGDMLRRYLDPPPA